MHHIHFGDNLPVLQSLPDESVDLIYIDPPFNTGKVQRRMQIKTSRSAEGDRTGFGGQRYTTTIIAGRAYADLFDDFLAFLEPRLVEARRILKPNGSLYFHIDYREAHYCKILLDLIFGRESFLNEIIWAYDYGARTRKKWPPKHDTIFLYVKDPGQYYFNYDAIERIPYMAPGLVGPERQPAAKRPRIPGGTPSYRPTGARKPVTRPKSRSGFCAASCRPPARRAVRCWTFSPAAAQPGRPVWSTGRPSAWWMTTRRPWR